jgi:hypothetical protein
MLVIVPAAEMQVQGGLLWEERCEAFGESIGRRKRPLGPRAVWPRAVWPREGT